MVPQPLGFQVSHKLVPGNLNGLRIFCFQVNETTADPSQGGQQSYVEDCQVCCRPLVLQVTIADGEAWAEATGEGG